MGSIIDINGNMEIVQGDSVEININGIPEDQNYKIYFAAQDEDRNTIGQEIMVESNFQPTVAIKLVGNYTDLFTVPQGERSAKFPYAVKMCSDLDNTEDTLRLGGLKLGENPVITVYPRMVKGI
jgi:hypothetical protein